MENRPEFEFGLIYIYPRHFMKRCAPRLSLVHGVGPDEVQFDLSLISIKFRGFLEQRLQHHHHPKRSLVATRERVRTKDSFGCGKSYPLCRLEVWTVLFSFYPRLERAPKRTFLLINAHQHDVGCWPQRGLGPRRYILQAFYTNQVCGRLAIIIIL